LKGDADVKLMFRRPRHFMVDYYEIIIGTGMFMLLVIGAICDHGCREVPDSISLPFLFLGIFGTFLHGRYICGCAVSIIYILFNHDIKPKFFQKLNKKMMARAYGEDEIVVAEEESAINERSDQFFAAHESVLQKVTGATFLLTVGVATICAWVDALSSHSNLAKPGVLTAIFIFIIWAHSKVEKPHEPVQVEHEELRSIGGADVIYLLGILAFLGLFRAIYAITAIFIAILIIILARKLILRLKGQPPERSVPLIFYFAWVAPIGYLASATIGMATADIYSNFSFVFTLI